VPTKHEQQVLDEAITNPISEQSSALREMVGVEAIYWRGGDMRGAIPVAPLGLRRVF
jgi:hypothetical protein